MITFNKIENIHIIKFKNINDNEILNYFDYLDNLYLKKKNFKLLFDISECTIFDSIYCKEQLNYMIINENNTKLYINKTSIFVNSNILKKLLDILIFSFKKPIKPNLISNNYLDCINFLKY